MTIEIQQPQPYDLVGRTILIAGNASGFEGVLNIRVTDGHDEVQTFTSNAGALGTKQFQASIEIPDDTAFTLNSLYVTVFDEGAGAEDEEGNPLPTPGVTIPVLFGPKILPGYGSYWEHTVKAGETLSSIAQDIYDDSSLWPAIHQANQHIIVNPDRIIPGQVLRVPRDF